MRAEATCRVIIIRYIRVIISLLLRLRAASAFFRSHIYMDKKRCSPYMHIHSQPKDLVICVKGTRARDMNLYIRVGASIYQGLE